MRTAMAAPPTSSSIGSISRVISRSRSASLMAAHVPFRPARSTAAIAIRAVRIDSRKAAALQCPGPMSHGCYVSHLAELAVLAMFWNLFLGLVPNRTGCYADLALIRRSLLLHEFREPIEVL